ncbi:MAG: sensor histidine kinase [Myxococcales bacterium]|nr:sensor histidine kinase [Myxococcales bacterium]
MDTERRRPLPGALGGGPTSGWRTLAAWRMWAFCWAPIVAISVLHYATPIHHAWVHDVLRRLYYLPIIAGAFLAELRGALAASVVVSFCYIPHAFLHMGAMAHADPAGSWEKALELGLYNIVGAVTGYLVRAERRRAAELATALEEQRRLQRQLVRAGRLGALGELVAGVSHEIKTPLHALRGTAEIVDKLIPADCPERRMWEIHVSELRRLGDIAERFRSFASPQVDLAGALDLNDVARRLSDLVGAQARRQGVEVELTVAPAPVALCGDRDQLAQVGLNIAVNALRAMAAVSDRKGTLAIRVVPEATLEDAPMCALRIENDGPPIPIDRIEHIFDPFVGDDPQGTGLGLAISARIAELHHGFIEASNAGLGVTFTLYLPRRDAPEPA